MNLQTTRKQYVRSKGITKCVKLETNSKIESEQLYKQWDIGIYNFLLHRTLNHYSKAKSSQRRQLISQTIQKELPLVSDVILLWLFQKAIKKHMRTCSTKYSDSGYQDTRSEKNFHKTIEKIIKSDPKYRHLEVYPSSQFSKDLEPNQKMTVGVLIPDFIVFGIKRRGCTSVAFEIDGDSHIYKLEKDFQKERNLESLGIMTLPIPNERAKDEVYIKKILDDCITKRSGPLDKQIKRNKRKIWAKTIACQFKIHEIEALIQSEFNLDLNLLAEATTLIKVSSCPRIIKREIKREVKNDL